MVERILSSTSAQIVLGGTVLALAFLLLDALVSAIAVMKGDGK